MFESIFLFFTSIWVLIAVAIFLSIVYTICVEHDTYGWAVIWTIVGAALCHQWLISLPWSWPVAILIVMGYGIIGAGWSLYRWIKYCRQRIADNPYENRAKYKESLTPEEYYSEFVDLRFCKSRIMKWIVLWPWSLLWTLTGDFFTLVYNSMRGMYEKTAAYVVRQAVKQIRK